MKKHILLLISLLLLCFPATGFAKETSNEDYICLKADIRDMTSPVSSNGGDSISISSTISPFRASSSVSKTSSISSRQVNALYQTLKSFKSSVNLRKYNVHESDMQVLLDQAFTKNYYVQDAIAAINVKYKRNYKGYVSTVKIEYHYSVKTMKKRYSNLKKAVTAAKKAIGTNLSKEEAVVAVHDYIIKKATFHTNYATQIENNPGSSIKYNYHSAHGVLHNKKGVCSGYSYAYRILLKEYDVESTFMESEAMNHGWNMVKLGKSWYHVDTTWDDPDANVSWTGKGSGDLVYYTFLLLNNEEIENANHYSWSPLTKSTSSTYSKMPRLSSREQRFYNGKWYLFHQEDTLYEYIEYSMKGKEKIHITSGQPIYILENRIIYQPDAFSLSSMNIDGSCVRSLNDIVTANSSIPVGTAYNITAIDSESKTLHLQYEKPIGDNSMLSPQTTSLALNDYDLRTTDYATKLTLSRSKKTIKRNKTFTLKASLGPDWPLLNDKVTFHISKTSKKIIRVLKTTAFSCQIKGIKKGTATITVKVPGTKLKKSCKVMIK